MALKVLKAARGKLGTKLTRKGPSRNPGFNPPKRTARGKAVSARTQHARGEANVPLKRVGKRGR